ncbi:MAG TPA: site-2 protease family protein [Candidatus Binataceae bacterium]|nr:site-2 protease family protein [Candidatus Binataceae bacterium]
MEQAAASRNTSALTEIHHYSAVEPAPETALAPITIPRVNVILFFLTFLTTTIAGAHFAGFGLSIRYPMGSLVGLAIGLMYSIPLMAILFSHEMGHYVTSRIHRVDATLPFFIPAPSSIFPLGTFGAFIRMKQPARTRGAMFDIGAAGPWAGVIVAIPCVIIGLYLSDVTPIDKSAGGIELGNSILFYALARVILGVDPNSVNVGLHPIALAGWLGLFVTTLNLLPVGQLDGGHVIYTLFPRQHRTIGKVFVAACVLMVVVPYALGWNMWAGWLLWAVLLVGGIGLGHPPTLDSDTPLDPVRRTAAWATVLLFIVTFSPVPFSFQEPEAPLQQQPSRQEHLLEVIHPTPHYDGMIDKIHRAHI